MCKKFRWLFVIVFISLTSCQTAELTKQPEITLVPTLRPTAKLETPTSQPTEIPVTNTPDTGPLILALDGQKLKDGEQFVPLPLDEYIADFDHQPDEIIWRVLTEGELNVQIKRRVLIVSLPDANWTGSETINLEACDPDEQCDTAEVTYAIAFVNDAPIVADIDDQLIFLGEEFQQILLDNYVDDEDNSDAEISWDFEGNVNLLVEIVEGVASITLPDAAWRGPETLRVTACDPGGLCDSDQVVFMVQEPDNLTITFIANAGFLLEAGDKKVAIDALLEPWGGYQSLTVADVIKMENARWPFDEIDLVFVTHNHFDHYDVNVLEAYLDQNPDSIGLSTQGVAENLQVITGDKEDLLERMIGLKIRSGKSTQMIIDGIGVELMNFPHGPGSPENLGVIFSIGGFRVFHTGDLDPDQTLDVLAHYGLSDKKIDVAMVPAFWLSIERYQSFLAEFNAPFIIPMHFDPSQSQTIETMRDDFPDAIFFNQIYEFMGVISLT